MPDDPRLHAVTEAMHDTKPDPYAGSLPRRRAEYLAPAVLPVIEAEVVAALRAMAERLDEEAKSYDGSFEDGLHMARMFLEAEASRLEPGQGVKEERP